MCLCIIISSAITVRAEDYSEILSTVSGAYGIPIDVLQTRKQEEVTELFVDIPNIISVNKKYYEIIEDNGESIAIEKTEDDYRQFMETKDDEANFSNRSNPNNGTNQWMYMYIIINEIDRWTYKISANWQWLYIPSFAIGSRDLLSLEWEDGYYIKNSADGFWSYSSNGTNSSGDLYGFSAPSGEKSITHLHEMTNMDGKSNVFFHMSAKIRKNLMLSCEDKQAGRTWCIERAYATYGHQINTIDWISAISIVGGVEALGSMFIVNPGSVTVIALVSAFVGIVSGLSGYNSGFQVVNIDADCAFSDTVGTQLDTFVTIFYLVCLNRKPEAQGLTNWVNALVNNTSGGTVAHGFFFSDEYIARSRNNNEYVMDLYRAMLDRTPTSPELGVWVAALESGYSRLQVFNGFKNSSEFSDYCDLHYVSH